MSDEALPPGWALTSIDQVATNYSGNSKLIKGKLSEQPGDGLFPAFSASGQDVWCNVAEEEGAAIIVSAVGARCGKAFRATGKWSAIANTHVVRINPHAGDFDFFFWLLNREHYWVKGGTAQPFVRVKATFERPFWLPPLAEQKRIVAKIEEVFSELEAGEESLRVARRQLGVYRQSLLQQAFEGKLTAKWRTKNRAKLESLASLPAVEGSHALPGGWQWIKLGSAIEEPAYGTSKKCSYESSGLGVLRIPNVVNGAIEADDLKFAEFTKDERESYELKAGDLLLIRSNGSVSIVGRCAVVEPKHTEFLYAGYLIRLRPRDTLLNSRFLLNQVASHRLRSQIEFSAKSTSGVNNINSKEIQRLIIALPSLPEQQEIVRVLDEQFEGIGRNEREIDEALRSSAALRQAILKKAFTGRLVPQDPSDEPASALLTRLRAERATPTENTTRRGRKAAAPPAII